MLDSPVNRETNRSIVNMAGYDCACIYTCTCRKERQGEKEGGRREMESEGGGREGGER